MHKTVMLSDIAADRPTEVEVGGQTLILVRNGDEVRAFEGKCPHAGAPLAKGAVCDGMIVCPWHKAAFALADGALLEPPALDGLASFPTEIRDGTVFVDSAEQAKPNVAATPEDQHVVILGAGAAAAACSAALREFGFPGAITMVGPESDPPYDRTALSKFVLEGGKAPDEVDPLREPGFYAANRINRIQASVDQLDTAGRRVVLAGGRTLPFTAAVVATGAAPNTPDLPGADAAHVFTLRSKADAARIVERAQAGGRAVILGNSFIGLEAASALRKRGLETAVVAPNPIPFAKQFGERIGTMFRRLHEAGGVRFHAPAKAIRIEAGHVLLDDGQRLPADLVLLGIGVSPVTAFAPTLPHADDGGIVVDAAMQAAPGVWAVGDVATFPFGGGTTRIEHWRVAQQQARVAARNVAGGAARYAGVPFFWTYHFGKRFEYLGHPDAWDDLAIEGSLDDQDFVALQLAAGQVVGALACQRERATATLIQRMGARLTRDEALALIRGAA